ncbi:MAG TPA: DNA gyrase inhibitor YacG [Bauldia sp.]|nr:DNA gyrase inhibitor YacG [Bauldia sp.]
MANPTAAPKRKCPICGKPAVVERLPFCSKRCADVDLHRWLSGGYVIAAAEETPSAEEVADPSRATDPTVH